MVPSSPPKLCHLQVIARFRAQADVVHTCAHMEDIQIMRNGAGADSCHGVYWLTGVQTSDYMTLYYDMYNIHSSSLYITNIFQQAKSTL